MNWRKVEYLGVYNIEIFTKDYGWITLYDDEGDKPLTFYREDQCEEFMRGKQYKELIHI